MKKIKCMNFKQSSLACVLTLVIMFGVEFSAITWFKVDTIPFEIMIGVVLICPFIFTYFLQGVWREDNTKNICEVQK